MTQQPRTPTTPWTEDELTRLRAMPDWERHSDVDRWFATLDRDRADLLAQIEKIGRSMHRAVFATMGCCEGAHALGQADCQQLAHELGLAAIHSAAPVEPTRFCNCTADTELGAGSTCTVCGHRDHGRSGCAAPVEPT